MCVSIFRRLWRPSDFSERRILVPGLPGSLPAGQTLHVADPGAARTRDSAELQHIRSRGADSYRTKRVPQ